MMDNEIIKSLKCCAAALMYDDEGNLYRLALDLINRQKAEIERLCAVVDKTDAAYYRKVDEVRIAKAEAIKEFAERLKEKFLCDEQIVGMAWVNAIAHTDILVKEMVGDSNASKT